MARKTRFTAELGLKIIAERESGASVAQAGGRHGIAESTVYLWLAYGEAGKEPFVGFARRFRAAKTIADDNFVLEQSRLLATA